jgi:hypothetical protein
MSDVLPNAINCHVIYGVDNLKSIKCDSHKKINLQIYPIFLLFSWKIVTLMLQKDNTFFTFGILRRKNK